MTNALQTTTPNTISLKQLLALFNLDPSHQTQSIKTLKDETGSFTKLPLEIIKHILSYLTLFEITNMNRVSKFFYLIDMQNISYFIKENLGLNEDLAKLPGNSIIVHKRIKPFLAQFAGNPFAKTYFKFNGFGLIDFFGIQGFDDYDIYINKIYNSKDRSLTQKIALIQRDMYLALILSNPLLLEKLTQHAKKLTQRNLIDFYSLINLVPTNGSVMVFPDFSMSCDGYSLHEAAVRKKAKACEEILMSMYDNRNRYGIDNFCENIETFFLQLKKNPVKPYMLSKVLAVVFHQLSTDSSTKKEIKKIIKAYINEYIEKSIFDRDIAKLIDQLIALDLISKEEYSNSSAKNPFITTVQSAFEYIAPIKHPKKLNFNDSGCTIHQHFLAKRFEQYFNLFQKKFDIGPSNAIDIFLLWFILNDESITNENLRNIVKDIKSENSSDVVNINPTITLDFNLIKFLVNDNLTPNFLIIFKFLKEQKIIKNSDLTLLKTAFLNKIMWPQSTEFCENNPSFDLLLFGLNQPEATMNSERLRQLLQGSSSYSPLTNFDLNFFSYATDPTNAEKLGIEGQQTWWKNYIDTLFEKCFTLRHLTLLLNLPDAVFKECIHEHYEFITKDLLAFQANTNPYNGLLVDETLLFLMLEKIVKKYQDLMPLDNSVQPIKLGCS